MCKARSVYVACQEPFGIPPRRFWQSCLRVAQGEPRQMMMEVAIRDMRLPLDGVVRIPALIQVTPVHFGQAEVRIAAEHQGDLYPTFRGLLYAHETRTGGVLELAGSYRLPMSHLGKLIDASLFAGAARASLQRFLRDFTIEISTRVQREEREYAKHAAGAGA